MTGRRLFDLFRRRRLEAELEEELRHHLESLEEEHCARGLSAEEARLAAERDLGGLLRAKEACRDYRRLPMAETLWRDVRFGARSLRRTPVVSLAVAATLAIAIGGTAAAFTVVNTVLLKPLPYRDAERLVSIVHQRSGAGAGEEFPSAPYLYFTFRGESRTLESLGLWRTGASTVTGLDRPEQVRTLFVTAEILPVLGVDPALGRRFSSSDDVPGAPATVMLSHAYWQRRFGGEPVIGRRMVIDGQGREVIGVLPPAFTFLDLDVDVLSPFQLDRDQVTLGRYVFPCLGRLKDGVTVAEATADLARLVPVAVETFPPPPGYTREQFAARPVVTRVKPLKEEVVGDVGRSLWVLMAALLLLLAMACANVANLMLVRTDGRERELAVRSALGAGWLALARELWVEALLLGLAGGMAGLAVAHAGVAALQAFGPPNLPRRAEIVVDTNVVLFVLATALVAGAAIGLLPVLKYARPRLAASLAGGGRSMTAGRERHRATRALVVAQVAVAVVLLVGSGLMIRTFEALTRVDPGFRRPEEIQLVHLGIAPSDATDAEHVLRMQNAIVDAMAAIPGVTSAAFADRAPLAGGNASDTVLSVQGATLLDGRARPLRRFDFIAPGLFRTLGTPVVSGRDVTWTDLYERRRVTLVSETLAREEWGSPEAAIGKRVRASPDDPWRDVIGVAGDLRDDGVSRPAPPIVYFPALMDHFWSVPTISFPSATFVVRSSRAGSESLLRDLQKAVWSVNASLPLAEVRTLDEAYRRSLARTGFTLSMLALAAAMGLLLGFIGIYGVIAYSVSQRRPEIAVRLALGATARALERMFLQQGLVLAAAGAAAGVAGAVTFTRGMSALLFGVGTVDPMTYAVVLSIVLATAVVATYVPARRATRGNAVLSLRS
jgi:putative ABC transport system permease protein